MTCTVTEIEILEVLDFDPECMSRVCAEKAEWEVTMKCCGKGGVYCTGCKVRFDAGLDEYISIRCLLCGEVTVFKDFEDFREWRKL